MNIYDVYYSDDTQKNILHKKGDPLHVVGNFRKIGSFSLPINTPENQVNTVKNAILDAILLVEKSIVKKPII